MGKISRYERAERQWDGLLHPNTRIGRFWYAVMSIGLIAIEISMIHQIDVTHPIIAFALIFVILYMLICLNKNRLNDCGWSGWWQFIPLAFIVCIFWPRDSGANKYGPAP